jgi:uncharacterized protein (DUF1697 family)
VQTYISSGNVVFRSASRNAGALATAIEQGLSPLLGFETHAFVRSAAQLHEVAGRGMALASDRALADVNVAFLGAALTADQVATLNTLRNAVDDFEAQGTEV